MLHIPVLRRGQPYESAERAEILHHATGELVALVSQANSGMVRRDILRMRDDVLEAFTVADLIEMSRKAAELFWNADLPLGDPGGETQSFNAYIKQLSATTGMPVTYCRRNAEKIRKVLDEMETVVGGLTRGLELEILDRGYGEREGHMLSFFRAGRIFGAVLPSNSPGVHSLWVPAIAFKAPVVLKPGREEPWTPLRIIEAFAAAGVPREAFGFYPTDHAGAGELLRSVDRSMLFGGGATVRPYENDPRVEVHGPGYSKIVLGDDCADDWEEHLDLMASSIAANGGRSCINASGVWTPRHGRAIAEALAKRLAKVEALPADDPKAEIAAFNNPAVAEAISATIDRDLSVQGAIDLTEQTRGSPRLVRRGRCAWLLPTIVWCEDREHPLANREFLFPYAAVVECPTADFLDAIGPSLIVSALTAEPELSAALMRSLIVDRLNIGPIPTIKLDWLQPHEGSIVEFLFRARAYQVTEERMATV